MQLLLGTFPSVPLLYRWKHFEGALAYCTRGVLVNGLLPDVLKAAYGKSPEEMLAIANSWEEDDPDLSFGLKQDVRVSKTVLLLADSKFPEKLHQAFLLGKPLRTFMDQVSLVETCRARFDSRCLGLSLANSKCTMTHAELLMSSIDIITGHTGRKVVRTFTEVLCADPTDTVWCPWSGPWPMATFESTGALILITMADSWRRLVFARQRQPHEVACAYFESFGLCWLAFGCFC